MKLHLVKTKSNKKLSKANLLLLKAVAKKLEDRPILFERSHQEAKKTLDNLIPISKSI